MKRTISVFPYICVYNVRDDLVTSTCPHFELQTLTSSVTTEMVAEESVPMKATVFNDFSRHAPLEKFHTIDGLLKSHAAESDQKPLMCYPKSGVSDFEEYTAKAIDEFVNSAVQYYIENGIQSAVTFSTRQTD